MASTDVNLADRSGNLVESHKGYDPRIIFFYFALAVLLLTLVCGLAYQQLIKTGVHNEAARQQNQRRIIMPGPRGNIYDREGRVLVGNRARFSAVLYVDELRPELRREQIQIRKNYRDMEGIDTKDVPNRSELEQIARVSVAQRYLDKVIAILHRDPNAPEAKINANRIQAHFRRELLLPYTLLDNLEPGDYAKLIEALPVNSPLQVTSTSSRYYPFNSAAAHTLGSVKLSSDADVDDLPGDKLQTFKMPGGTAGRDGLELQFDDVLQGTAGGAIYRVDPSGFKINPPLELRLPRQGKSITTSLDIDLQLAAEEGLGDVSGAAVVMDVATGEVLVMASKPDYDLNGFSPRATPEFIANIEKNGAWLNLAVNGLYPPGSTFKTIVTIAGLRSGRLSPEDRSVDCTGYVKIGNRLFGCDNGHGHHGTVNLPEGLAHSCDSYYWRHGLEIGPNIIAAEARRFHLDVPTGIELPNETPNTIVPTAAWKKENRANEGPWSDGDTANTSIGQGYLRVTPLHMACVAASIARGEVWTQPTLLHEPNRPRQKQEPIGLTPAQRAALLEGMVGCTTYGTAELLTTAPLYRIPGVKIAGKTGTAQKKVTKDDKTGNINFAWFICFAPAENPEIAMAVIMEGDTIGENFGGGTNAGPVAAMILRKYFEKKNHPGQLATPLLKQTSAVDSAGSGRPVAAAR